MTSLPDPIHTDTFDADGYACEMSEFRLPDGTRLDLTYIPPTSDELRAAYIAIGVTEDLDGDCYEAGVYPGDPAFPNGHCPYFHASLQHPDRTMALRGALALAGRLQRGPLDDIWEVQIVCYASKDMPAMLSAMNTVPEIGRVMLFADGGDCWIPQTAGRDGSVHDALLAMREYAPSARLAMGG